MSIRKTKKASTKILKEILEKYELDKPQLDEMKILLFEFVQFMNTKQVKETLLDYHMEISAKQPPQDRLKEPPLDRSKQPPQDRRKQPPPFLV